MKVFCKLNNEKVFLAQYKYSYYYIQERRNLGMRQFRKMEQIRKRVFILLAMLVLACGSATVFSTVTTPITAEAAAIKINKKKLTLYKGEKYKLKITGTKGKVTWKSTDSSVVKVNSKGMITARKAGKAQIIARVKGKAKKYTCTVTVKSKKKNKSTVRFYASSSRVNMEKTGSVKITYNGGGSIYFDVEDTSVCTCSWAKKWEDDTITLNIEGWKSGVTNVTITNSSNDKEINISVNVDLYAKSVHISSSAETIYNGDSIDLTASVSPSYAEQGIEWSSSDESVATVSSYGSVEAEGEGTAIITATSEDGHCSAQCVITVKSPVNFIVKKIPKEIFSYGYNNKLNTVCNVDNVYYEVHKSGDEFYYKIYLEGEKIFDSSGDNISSTCKIGYKISKDGVVVEAGTFYSPEIKVGERFSKYTNGFLESAGDYQIELLDVT